MQRAVNLVASGRVQGVGFRAFVRDAAAEYGLVGWVRNLENGDVEIWAEGDAASLERLAVAVRVGPPFAAVRDLRRRDLEASGSHQGFEIRFRDRS